MPKVRMLLTKPCIWMGARTNLIIITNIMSWQA